MSSYFTTSKKSSKEIHRIELLNKINDKRDKIERLKTEIFKMQSKRWEDLYKNRCKEYFLNLKEFIDGIAFDNSLGSDVDDFKKSCSENVTEVTITTILREMENHNLEFIPDKIKKMICEACSCQNCKSIKEHLGHTCRDCINNKYQYYSGYCDE